MTEKDPPVMRIPKLVSATVNKGSYWLMNATNKS